jgi:hypothetical protein
MKFKVMIGVLVLMIACLSLAGCKERIPVPPVDTAKEVAKLVKEGMTVEQVYALMVPQYKNTTMMYPAQTVEKQLSGSWKIGSLEGGMAESSDAPYQILIFLPDKQGEDCFMIFFEENELVGSAWFAPNAADSIRNLLKGTISK